MERILVPLDGSVLSEAIVPVAEILARDYGAELLLLRAVRPRTAPGADALETEANLASEAEAYLKRVAGELQERGLLRVSWSVRFEKPEQAIAEAAARNHVDLIAMTTHGRTGLGRLLLGSVAESLVRQAPAPVLLVRGAPAWRREEIRKILVPLDGSELSAEILRVVKRLAGPLDLSIVLLHVVEPIHPSAAGEASARREEMLRLRLTDADGYLAKITDSLQAKGLRVRHVARVGRAVDVIPEYARSEEVGLIAMTTHGRTGLGRLFFGSVAERVMRTAPVPVLLWKAREN